MTTTNSRGRWWVGIDVGGTFTDVVAVNHDTGEGRDHKVLTTRGELERGVLQALREVEVPVADIDEIVHGHTAGINAVLSRQGARAALVATAGHRDLLDIGRMEREFGPRFYDPTWLRPHQERPIIRRRNRYGVRERIGWDGAETLPLDEDEVRSIGRELRAGGIESVAICFLNAYLTQEHEERAADIIREECPGVYVQTSGLYPVTKEHERTTTIALDAYVGPIVTGYLERLDKGLQEAGFSGPLWIMTMNGGVGTVHETSKAPVFQLVSGPVGGVSGGVHVTRTTPNDNMLTMDVGGTSTDVAAIRRGQTPLTDLWSVEHGLTMTMPVVDVHSVGSGAGSIIHIDGHGALRVGPESAGSTPGPACYGRGGERPTLTDACVVLGVLQPDLFAGGSLRLDADRARRALASVGEPLGMSPIELADGAYRLACSDVAGSIRSITTYRGLDVREFALLAFGAAGPMVADQVARDLGGKTIVVPPNPGEFSAYGLLASDLRVTRARSPMAVLGAYGSDKLEAAYGELERTITDDLSRQGVRADDIVFERAFSAMYAGQTWDNRLPLAPGPVDDARVQEMHAQFNQFYLTRYGFSAEELPIVLTTIEVTGVARRPALPPRGAGTSTGDALIRRGSIRLGGVDHPETPIYDRRRLPVGSSVRGPAVISEAYATTVVGPSSEAAVDEHGHLNISLD